MRMVTSKLELRGNRVTVTADDATALIRAIFRTIGCPDEVAFEVAEHLVDASLCAVEEFFHDRIERARAEGAVPAGIDARPTAQALLGLFLGLRVLTRARSSREPLNAIKAQARAMLE